MKFVEGQSGSCHTIELTRRNLEILLEKLGDPKSQCTLLDPDRKIFVRAVEDEEHYSDRPPGAMYMPSTGVIE
jgi:hypothetical protein